MTPAPKRRWFRWSLRTMFVVVGIVAVWGTYYFSPPKREGRAIRALERAGIGVSYDFQRAFLPTSPLAPKELNNSKAWGYSYQVAAPGSSLVRALFGKEFFQAAFCVSFDNAPVSVEDFSHVAQLQYVRDLWMHNAGIGDDHMVSLAGLATLESVILSDNKISDRGLAYLSQSTDLQRLELSKNNVDGTGLKYLKRATNLRHLGLHDNPVSDEGLVHLTTFTDLAHLGLANSNITDQGLRHLFRLSNLQYLGLSGTHVTKAAATEFQNRFPNCKVESYGLP